MAAGLCTERDSKHITTAKVYTNEPSPACASWYVARLFTVLQLLQACIMQERMFQQQALMRQAQRR